MLLSPRGVYRGLIPLGLLVLVISIYYLGPGFRITAALIDFSGNHFKVVATNEAIPNVVHLVWLLRSPEVDFRFAFKHFLCVYAVLVHWKPDKIYLHTDASAQAITRARSDEAFTRWTRLIFNLPSVEVHYVEAPETVPGRPDMAIDLMEHKSDFVRVAMVKEYGGVYLDFDVFPLQDYVETFLKSGYRNVLGRQGTAGEISCGLFMAVRESELMTMWKEQMAIVFDGSWTLHSCDLLTKLAEELLVNRTNEVGIWERHAFNPWIPEPWSRGDLLTRHGETDSRAPSGLPPDDDSWRTPPPVEAWEQSMSLTYAKNLTKTYAIHAFALEDWEKDFRTTVSVEYMLARQSKFSRALFPVLLHAFDQGVLSINDWTLYDEDEGAWQ